MKDRIIIIHTRIFFLPVGTYIFVYLNEITCIYTVIGTVAVE
jgi:hypothetical protein